MREDENEQSYSLDMDLSEITNVNVKTENDELDLAADLQEAYVKSYFQQL